MGCTVRAAGDAQTRPGEDVRSVLGGSDEKWVRRKLDPAPVMPYRVSMSEELSKQIDDLHKRFDDLRTDMNQRFVEVNQRFGELREDMGSRITETNRRIDDLRVDMNPRLTDLNRTFRVFMWVVSGWFTFLTAVLAVFGFLRL